MIPDFMKGVELHDDVLCCSLCYSKLCSFYSGQIIARGIGMYYGASFMLALFFFKEVIMVALKPMTRHMCHEFYKGFKNDPAIGHYYEYVYTPEIADLYFDTNSVADRKFQSHAKTRDIGNVHEKKSIRVMQKCVTPEICMKRRASK